MSKYMEIDDTIFDSIHIDEEIDDEYLIKEDIDNNFDVDEYNDFLNNLDINKIEKKNKKRKCIDVSNSSVTEPSNKSSIIQSNKSSNKRNRNRNIKNIRERKRRSYLTSLFNEIESLCYVKDEINSTKNSYQNILIKAIDKIKTMDDNIKLLKNNINRIENKLNTYHQS